MANFGSEAEKLAKYLSGTLFISSDITFSGYNNKVCHDITIQWVIIFDIYRAGWKVVILRLKIANFHSDWAAYSLITFAGYMSLHWYQKAKWVSSFLAYTGNENSQF